MIINTKIKMYECLKNGLFGNTAKIYNSLQEIPENEILSMRYNQAGNMDKCNPNITKKEIIDRRINLSEVTISQQPQQYAKPLLNGEITRNQFGLDLKYKIGNMWMRPAMKIADRAIGLYAQKILDVYLTSSDYDCLIELLDKYEDHIIEFTVFDNFIGTIPNRNTIIWEVRKY